MEQFDNPVNIGFPLRGEWTAPLHRRKESKPRNRPIGERYAFDFVRVDWARTGKPFYRQPASVSLLGRSSEQVLWLGTRIYAPCDGEVIKAEDGYKERRRVNVFSDSSVALKNAYTFNPEKNDIQTVAGNYIVMKCTDHVYAAFAHLQAGSITVSAGQVVRKGDALGKVGHSGNSTDPHLHFKLMDSSDWRSAKGIPCAFEQYEVSQDGEWKTVYRGVPSDKDRIRFEP